MLVLSRKLKESVVVGMRDCLDRTLKVTVLRVHGGKVRLGFEAHKDLVINRWEVWEKITRGVLTHPTVTPALPIM